MILSDRYYLRLDDAHEQMNWKNWERMEDICVKYGIKPLVALIPYNKDSDICYESKLKKYSITTSLDRWQKVGWHIGVHGYDHVLETVDPKQNILPLNNNSEFVHLSRSVVQEKVIKAVDNFKKRNLKSKIFVAPAHSFNMVTLDVLKESTDIRFISDGWDYLPFTQNGITFLPQQLWKFRRMYVGHWTICLHPSSMCEDDFEILDAALKRHRNRFGSFDELITLSENYKTRKNSIFFKLIWKIMLQVKRKI